MGYWESVEVIAARCKIADIQNAFRYKNGCLTTFYPREQLWGGVETLGKMGVEICGIEWALKLAVSEDY